MGRWGTTGVGQAPAESGGDGVDMDEGGRLGSDTRPLRVLWLIKQLGAGGAERLLVSAAKRHDRDRVSLEAAYLLRDNDALVGELEETGVPVHCLGVDHGLDLRWIPRLRRLLREHDFDVVHIHSALVASLARPVIRLRRRGGSRPALVVTEHAAWGSYARGTRIANHLTLPLDDVHLAVSEAARQAMPRRFRARTEVVIHGVLTDELSAVRAERDAVREELGVSDDEVLVVTVANLVMEKGYPDLLRAARRVLDENPQVRFVAAGRGHLEAKLLRLHQSLGLGDRFRFLGFRPDPVRLMTGGDLMAMSSIWEGYPVAVMEALSVGLPIVATAVGGVPEAVRDGVEGYVTPPHHPQLLAEAILRMAGDAPARKRMAVAALERSHNFDIRTTVARLEDIYQDLSAGARS